MLHLVLVRHRVKGEYAVHECHDIDPVDRDVWENHASSLMDLYITDVMIVPQEAGSEVMHFRGPSPRELVAGWTDSLVAYDYGYVYDTGERKTVRISDAHSREYRKVYMPKDQADYQTGRYQSGGYNFLIEGTNEFNRILGAFTMRQVA